MSSLRIVILAAGQGRRMCSTLPKVLHSLGGKPLLQHVIEVARTLRPVKIVVIYGHGGEVVKSSIPDSDVVWAYQASQLGTGDAVKCGVSSATEEMTLVLYGDVPLITASTLLQLVEMAAPNKIILLTDKVADPTGYGRIVRDAQGRVTKIIEHKEANAAIRAIDEINTGIAIFPTAKLVRWLDQLDNNNAQQEYYLTDVFAMAVAAGVEIATLQPAARWEAEGVNNKHQLAALERIYQQQYAHRLLEEGVTLLDPARIDIRGELNCDQDVVVDVNVVFEGMVTLGRGVHIGAHCVLKNVEIGAGTVVAPFSYLDGAVIGADSRIGPFARLRPGTHLAEAVHIGNFVEVKKSKIAAKTKINHLTYIGDADIGTRTNIGAGTVTVNYNGVDKFCTTIGNDVRVGSGTMLVAPICIGDGATIGAGSTITHDAPADRLTVARVKQLTIEGWQRPVKKSCGKN